MIFVPATKYVQKLFLCALALGVSACSLLPDSLSPKKVVPYEITESSPIEFMQDGGWCWFEDPRVIIHNGKLIIGVISGVSGDIKVGVYDLKTETLDGVKVLHKDFEVDDHNSPVFYVRPDNSLVAMWAMHGKENKHYYAISEPDNYLNWSKTKIHNHNYVQKGYWHGVTYMNLFDIENQNRVYNFFRHGLDFNPHYISSDDYGLTWNNDKHFIKDNVEGRHRPYVRYQQMNENRIGFTFTNAHPRRFGNSLFYAQFNGERFHRADGSLIKSIDDGALAIDEAEKIYLGSETLDKPEGSESVPNSAWTIDLERDSNANPYIGYSVFKQQGDIRYRLANWNGESWIDREIAYAGSHLYDIESSYSGLLAIDPVEPENIIISSDVNPQTGEKASGQYEIYMANIADEDTRETINWTPLTNNSEYKNIRPIIVAGEGYKVALWLSGPWQHFQSYQSNIVGYILEKPDL